MHGWKERHSLLSLLKVVFYIIKAIYLFEEIAQPTLSSIPHYNDFIFYQK